VMTINDRLRLRVELAVKSFRNELLAEKNADNVLPVDKIEVDIITGGVKVAFFEVDKNENKKTAKKEDTDK